MVVTIEDRQEISAPIDQVWDIIADVDNDPKHWPILYTITILARTGT